jgi:CPA2 family monovalent cation:H+ antiporter-2
MHHSVPLIATIAAAFGLALLLGFVAARLKLPALVGYLAAGIAIGPATPGFVADVGLAGELAEIGVMLLMFGVGLHFSLQDLMAVRRIAVPGAVLQMGVATAMGVALGMGWGWSFGAALVFGLALSVASTVVLLKALESREALDTGNGRIAVGWLVVEDLAMVLVLVLLPALAGLLGGQPAAGHDGGALLLALGRTLLAVVVFVVLMLVVGRRLFPWVLWQVARTGSRELFTLAVVAAAVTLAFGSARLFGVSYALGAFFAGMVLRESQFSHRAAEDTLPLRDAFAVLFFVSVGMLFDPQVLVESPGRVLAVVAVIVLGKSLAAAALVLLLRYPLNTALVVSASLAQIGEFSFILAGLGASLKLLPAEGHSLILAGALISIALNPLLFAAVAPLQRWLLARSQWARHLAGRDDPLAELPAETDRRLLSRQVVLVGHGRVGRAVALALQAEGIAHIVVDARRDRVEALRAQGRAAVFGDAAEAMTLVQAHVAEARLLVIATPETVAVRTMIELARRLNPAVEVLVRSDNEEEAKRLAQAPGVQAVVPEGALAEALVARVRARLTGD